MRFRRGAFSSLSHRHAVVARIHAANMRPRSTIAAGRILAPARTIPGSFDALCVAYYRSPEFLALKPITQGDRRRIVERLRADYGKLPVARIERRHIKALMASLADTPQAANNLLKVLRVLLNTAVDLEMIPANPAVGVKRYKQIGDGFPTWSEAEVAQFRAAHAIGTKPRLALELLLGTGQRRSDVVCFGWQHVDGDDLVLRQSKTDTPLRIPIAPELAAALAAIPRGNLTFLLDDRGRSFDARAFGTWFRRRCAEAGLVARSAHGLRKLAATRLANAGCSTDHIRAITGHRSREVDRYTVARDQAKLAREAARMLRADQDKTGTGIVQQIVQLERKS